MTLKRLAPFAFVLGVGLFLRLYLLTDKSIWIDEIQHITWAKGYDVSGFLDVRSQDLGIRRPPRDAGNALREIRRHVPAFSDLMLNLWMRAWGSDSDFALKLPFALFGVLCILGVILLAHDLFGRRAAIAAGLLVACSPFHVYYSQEVNHYAAASCWVAWSYVFYFRFLRSGRFKHGAALAVFGALALYSHYYSALVVFSQGVGIIIYFGARLKALARAAIPLVVSVALLGVDFRVVLAHLFGHASANFGGEFGGARFFYERLVANLLHPWIGELANSGPALWIVLPLLVVVAALFVLGLRAHEERRLRWLIAVNTLLPLAFLFAAYGLMKNNQLLWPRYVIFFSFTLFVAVGAFFVGPALRARHVAAAVVLTIAMGAGLHHYYHRFKKRDWRSAAQAIATNGDARDAVIVFVPNVVYALARYLSTEQRLFGVSEEDLLNGVFDRATADRPGVWTVFAWASGSPVLGAIRKRLACQFPFRDDHGIHLIELSRHHDGLRRTPTTQVNRDCSPRNGFVVARSSCVMETGAEPIRVVGWVETADRLSTLSLVIKGPEKPIPLVETPAPPPDAPPQPDPPAGTTRRWFQGALDLAGIAEGAAARISLAVRRSDGAVIEAREDLLCLRRHPVARTGVPGPLVANAYIDAPGDGANIEQGDRFVVSGWAFSSGGISELVYKIDGREVRRSPRHGIARPDVATVFRDVNPSVATYSGFSEVIETATLSQGPHRLTLETISPQGATTPIAAPRIFHIVNFAAIKGRGPAGPAR
ncbi:MAG: glycosyltransferase family 39 protein [Deltaproteobacteria bacterium]|nr:glycosyltransferase family 39 protein [Deltaproteobacteria bacterium]